MALLVNHAVAIRVKVTPWGTLLAKATLVAEIADARDYPLVVTAFAVCAAGIGIVAPFIGKANAPDGVVAIVADPARSTGVARLALTYRCARNIDTRAVRATRVVQANAVDDAAVAFDMKPDGATVAAIPVVAWLAGAGNGTARIVAGTVRAADIAVVTPLNGKAGVILLEISLCTRNRSAYRPSRASIGKPRRRLRRGRCRARMCRSDTPSR